MVVHSPGKGRDRLAELCDGDTEPHRLVFHCAERCSTRPVQALKKSLRSRPCDVGQHPTFALPASLWPRRLSLLGCARLGADITGDAPDYLAGACLPMRCNFSMA